MHVKYVSSNAPVLAQIINDFALLLAGSPISALSASCDKANSILISTVAPGWTVVDAAATFSGCVVSAPDADGLTTKYVKIHALSATLMDVACYESWNSTTHVGTNPTSSSTSAEMLVFTPAAVNTFWIFATPRSLYISDVAARGIGAIEFTRDCQYLQGTTYPCVISVTASSIHHSNNGGNLYGGTNIGQSVGLSRMKNLLASGDQLGSSCYISTASLAPKTTTANSWNFTISGTPTVSLRDASDLSYHEIRPIWVSTRGIGAPLACGRQAIIGKLYDVAEITANAANTFDTLLSGSDTYMVLNTINVGSIAFKIA